MSSLAMEACTESRPQSHIGGMSVGITQDQLWLAFELVVACNGTGHPFHRKVSTEDLSKYAQGSVGSLYVPEEQVFEMGEVDHTIACMDLHKTNYA